ncbi:hypothetical protein UA08_06002 [Talaromyces atroroseus]|uniref:UBC core domain-containing protein n=1 Tax=Talaromyces atroroseus TaxID=1441469 RepID=A0A225AS37_TALAT|nr:hypothetical protein UA08_06002 [Talaromyces atroroseus]OKL58399.1 hypothetical protein UA08_06002 [Talaromyces atroroseus]
MSDQAIIRIAREIRQIQQGHDLSLAVACDESDIRKIKALIVGPPNTPYEFGFFEFTIKFPEGEEWVCHSLWPCTYFLGDYPASPPKVTARTTNSGRCRFNPNIYAGGKVCLTWPGQKGEEWSSAQGLESVLISIQSLMSTNPYENEPGYENRDSALDRKAMANYIDKIKHETLRIAVIQPLEDALGIKTRNARAPSPTDDGKEADDSECPEEKVRETMESFDDLRKRRFLWYYESYIHTIEVESKKVKVNEQFKNMSFEGPSNEMAGSFKYPQLKERLGVIKDEIINETKRWAIEGLAAQQQEVRIADNLHLQYKQIVEDFKERKDFTVDLSLVDESPFVWLMTYFGRPMTNLGGGVFKIKIHLSTKFPDEQPRVFVETPIFHHRVSKDGVLCYFTDRPGELRYHIDAIVQTLEEESPPFDPRTTVNLEASTLFWGTPEDRKKYNRALRRSVENSTESQEM